MRVSTNLLQSMGIQALLDRQADVSKTQLHIATGKRILTPQDDPAGAARILNLNSHIETITQYQSNIDQVESRLSLEEVTLSSMSNVLQRLRELAVQGANDTLGTEGRAGLAEEVDQRLDELLGLANTRDSNGEYLFGGFAVDAPPFTDLGGGVFRYNGDHGTREIQIGSDRQIVDRNTGFDVAMDIQNSAGAAQDMFTTVSNFLTNMQSNTPNPTDIDDIDAAMQNVVRIRAEVGGRLNAMEAQKSVNADTLVDTQTTRSAVEDLDYATAVADFEGQLVAFQASQQAFVKVQGLSLFNFL